MDGRTAMTFDEILDQALALLQRRGRLTYRALRLLGDIHAHHQPPQAELAEAAYHEALAQAEALGMRPLQAHCHLGLGTLYVTQGQAEQARTALSTAIALYQDMGMTFWLPQAEVVLTQLEAQ
jgi:hypothetical protein